MLINRLFVSLATICAFASAVSADEPVDVGMIQLLANPAKFHGKRIRVEGFLHAQFEDECLYLSKEDADFLNGKHSFWMSYSNHLSAAPKKPLDYFDGKRVLVIGVFDKNEGGHLGAAAGGIKDVSDIMEQTRWFDGKKQLKK